MSDEARPRCWMLRQAIIHILMMSFLSSRSHIDAAGPHDHCPQLVHLTLTAYDDDLSV